MNLSMSRRADYCVRAALYLARTTNNPEATKVKEIVAEMGIPATFASQILADLVRADIATSKPGRDGGYRLKRDTSSITLLELVEAGEGSLRADHCALGEGPCRWDTVCPLHASWQSTVAAVRQQLSTITLAAIAEEDLRLEGAHENPIDSHRSFHRIEAEDSSYVELPLMEVEQLLGRLHDQQLIEELRDPINSIEALQSTNLAMAYLLDGGRRLILELIDSDEQSIRLELDLEPIAIDPKRVELRGHAKIRSTMSTDSDPLVRVVLNKTARLLEGLATTR
ncbi:RrF2 family transcriptional regulator [Ferrimicrobium acidiphilum]|uniref:HTH-type transcriptional regulator IscR n=1 Tax=Ferrimicrobium acidiphilum DSM 19497 TaxID=1121877 RepID=A0A0D8FUL1_9ACTN|nr:Rrf2 family transcriptional regulator [Ferrimicrobium acidiphilum]KJE76786.1 HTH-type transcriptional regulator IscR [Ferrimicrobium acidiphilum DSM 19497]MCL5052795.1 Rrf2 family transcriptional regulator [Gammaproteobacteria bacterium]